MACYSGPNPVTDDERRVIWEWAKKNVIDPNPGISMNEVADQINSYFFGGLGKPEWGVDILSGRKMPYKALADDAWRKANDRRAIIQQAKQFSQIHTLGPVAKTARFLWTLPRGVATAGHFLVFPVSHGGDLLFRPESWDTYFKNTFNVWTKSLSKAQTERVVSAMERQPRYTLSRRSGLDAGPGSHPSGIINRTFGGASNRAWDLLKVMRFELWDKEMQKFIKPGMSSEEVLDIGKNLADWANHATGSAKIGRGKLASGLLFGPKLTASKLSRIGADWWTTGNTIKKWQNASAGEKAVAWTRVKGAAQYGLSYLTFLGINQGLISALGDKKKEDQINFTDPTKGDFLAFKAGGIELSLPGLHTELRTLAKIIAVPFESPKQLHREPLFPQWGKIVGLYGMGKLTPTIEHGIEIGGGYDWQGRPMPWKSDPGTAKKPRLTWGEYAGSIGPIPLEGPIGYVYDHLKQAGASSLDAMTIVKGLIISGLGLTGLRVEEVPPPQKPKNAP